MTARPIIGIEVDVEAAPKHGRLFSKCYKTYSDAVWRVGGHPMLIAPVDDEAYVSQVIRSISGLVVPGGDDIDPRFYGEPAHECSRFVSITRARYDFGCRLVRAALAAKLPFLGVCYGAQLLNLLRGGRTIQDLEDHRPGSMAHKSEDSSIDLVHDMSLAADSRLAKILGPGPVQINSVHHQAVETVGTGLKAVAWAPDGVIEAIEGESEFLLGVQWHPERGGCEPSGDTLFAALVEAAREYMAARV